MFFIGYGSSFKYSFAGLHLQVGKCNRYDDDPFSSCATKIDGWVSSAPAVLT
jgi:hypothetical protein